MRHKQNTRWVVLRPVHHMHHYSKHFFQCLKNVLIWKSTILQLIYELQVFIKTAVICYINVMNRLYHISNGNDIESWYVTVNTSNRSIWQAVVAIWVAHSIGRCWLRLSLNPDLFNSVAVPTAYLVMLLLYVCLGREMEKQTHTTSRHVQKQSMVEKGL